MSEVSSTRRDAVRNRALLLSAARELFSTHGPDVPLELIAQSAGVSRTTLTRHFASRADLAGALLEEDVCLIEAMALEITNEPQAAVRLFDYALDLQLRTPWLAHVLSRSDAPTSRRLWERTATAFRPLLAQAVSNGDAYPDVTIRDVMIAFPMLGTAVIEDRLAGRAPETSHSRLILRRGLFSTRNAHPGKP